MNAIALYARPAPDYAAKYAESLALLRSLAPQHAPLTQASSLGAEDMVVTHLVHASGLDCGLFVLDTGMLHAQTLALIAALQRRYQRPVEVFRPDPEAAHAFVAANGSEAMYRSVELRKACCQLRKLEPLERALQGKRGWLTGLRREQSQARSEVPLIEQQTGRVKVNPLANWTWGDVWHCIAQHQLDYNPLHDAFYPSIGCAPCTRAVTLGEDPRSGRWWWEQQGAKECGLHLASIPSTSQKARA
jgi:phosphoadenosine phosphosulfate reductase